MDTHFFSQRIAARECGSPGDHQPWTDVTLQHILRVWPLWALSESIIITDTHSHRPLLPLVYTYFGDNFFLIRALFCPLFIFSQHLCPVWRFYFFFSFFRYYLLQGEESLQHLRWWLASDTSGEAWCFQVTTITEQTNHAASSFFASLTRSIPFLLLFTFFRQTIVLF